MIDVTETDEALGHGSYCVTVKVKYGHTVCAAKRLHDVLLTSWDKVSDGCGVSNWTLCCKFSIHKHSVTECHECFMCLVYVYMYILPFSLAPI